VAPAGVVQRTPPELVRRGPEDGAGGPDAVVVGLAVVWVVVVCAVVVGATVAVVLVAVLVVVDVVVCAAVVVAVDWVDVVSLVVVWPALACCAVGLACTAANRAIRTCRPLRPSACSGTGITATAISARVGAARRGGSIWIVMTCGRTQTFPDSGVRWNPN